MRVGNLGADREDVAEELGREGCGGGHLLVVVVCYAFGGGWFISW